MRSDRQDRNDVHLLENKTSYGDAQDYFPAVNSGSLRGQEERQDSDLIAESWELRNATLHAVAIPTDSLHPDPKLMGVGCETCHGAAPHIAALTHGRRDHAMERLARQRRPKSTPFAGLSSIDRGRISIPVSEQHPADFLYLACVKRCYQASGQTPTHTPYSPAITHENAKRASSS